MTSRRLAPIVCVVLASMAMPLAASAISPIVTGTDTGATAHTKAFNGQTLVETASFLPYSAFTGGVRVAAGDVTGDGLADIVTGAGPGAGPHVKVYSAPASTEVRSFFAYGAGFTGGVYVAAGDVNGDQFADLVTGAGSTSSHVKVFNGVTSAEFVSFLAFPGALGVRVAAGDVNGDGRADIIAGTAPGGGQVKVFDGVSLSSIRDFIPYPSFTGGVFVASGDITGDGKADIITGTDDSPGAASVVRVFDAVTLTQIRSFIPYAGFAGGVRVAAGDVNGDGTADIITGTGVGAAHVKVFDGVTNSEIRSFLPYASFTGGIFVAGETPIPEPASLAFILGATGAVLLRRR